MRRHLAALLIGLAAAFPAALLAQTDGSTGTDTPPASDAPMGTTATEVPPQEQPAAADPVSVTPEPAPAGTPATETAPAPASETPSRPEEPASAPSAAAPAAGAPAVQLTQSQPSPTQPVPAGAIDVASPEPSPVSPSLEDAQVALETVAGFVPSALQPWLYALAGAIAAIVALLGIQELSRRFTKNSQRPCPQCGRGGHEHGTGACATCSGLGQVEEEYEGSVECPHCQGEGQEPCEECEGAGKVAEVDCGFCEGGGVKRDMDGEPMDCSACRGEGEVAGTLTRNKPCPDCEGAE